MLVWLTNAKELQKKINSIEGEVFRTRKKCSKSLLIDSRNSRFRAVAADRLGGKRASEKTP